MKTVVPDYYNKFKCIADKCKHSCCIGWEIDIDDNSLNYYENLKGEIGKKLRENIVKDDCPHFKLKENERCPFLNSNNLCELILNCGEDSLCQICNDHPRFRNYFSECTEIGLGLCCEEVANIILNYKDKVKLLTYGDSNKSENNSDFENEIISVRNRAFEIMQNRNISVDERISILQNEFNFSCTKKDSSEWKSIFFNFERLSKEWDNYINKINDSNDSLTCYDTPFEQLILYFIYRYLPLSFDETDIKAYLSFAVLSYRIIKSIFIAESRNNGFKMNKLEEIVRLYSSEIEYSDVNMSSIRRILRETNNK